MNLEAESLQFVDDFSGFHYISDAQIVDTGERIEIQLESIPIGKIGLFMTCLWLAMLVGLVAFGTEFKTTLMLASLAGLGASGFVGALYLANRSVDLAVLPAIDKKTATLILPGGTRIARSDIRSFRQFECKTRASNFHLVATVIITSPDNLAYAVCAETGRFGTALTGKQLAEQWGITVGQSNDVVQSKELLARFGHD